MYFVTLSSLQMEQGSFTSSYAPIGALIYAEGISGKTVSLNNVNVTNISTNTSQTTLIQLTSGSFFLSNSQFDNINSALFRFDGTQAVFTNVIIV